MTPVVTSIDAIAAGGAGVGRLPDGRAVFVPLTAPGDRIAVRITEERARYARGELVEVLEAGRGRRTPPCPYYERCGGCTIEHLEYEAQLAAKARIVRDAIERIGGTPVDLPAVVPSPREFHYRNRMSFTLLRARTGRVVAGLHDRAGGGRIVEIDGQCLLPEPALAAAWDALRKGWGPAASRLPAGRRLRLTLRVTRHGDASLLVDGARGRGRPRELLENVPALAAVWARTRPAEAPRRLAGRVRLAEDWHRTRVTLGGATFLQVNREAAEILEDHVLERAGDVSGKRVVDAYCGIGFYALRLAERGARVTGLERDPVAVAEARRQVPPDVTLYRGDVEDLLPDALPADLLIANPPRAGMHPRVCDALCTQPPARILYVSCDPATLARDVARLAPTFTLRALQCFDLFPQTAHTEIVAELACATT